MEPTALAAVARVLSISEPEIGRLARSLSDGKSELLTLVERRAREIIPQKAMVIALDPDDPGPFKIGIVCDRKLLVVAPWPTDSGFQQSIRLRRLYIAQEIWERLKLPGTWEELRRFEIQNPQRQLFLTEIPHSGPYVGQAAVQANDVQLTYALWVIMGT